MRHRRQRRRAHHEQGNHERWLVSYADFITLLFAFFVVLYSSAQTDNKKVVRIAAAIKGAFQDLGVFTRSGSDIGAPKKIIIIPAPENGSPQQAFFSTVVPPSAVSASGSAAQPMSVGANGASKSSDVSTRKL